MLTVQAHLISVFWYCWLGKHVLSAKLLHQQFSWLLIPDGDPCGLRSDVSVMCHVRTALSVTNPSMLPVREHGMSCRSIYVTLGYRWLLSMNISRPTYSLPCFETTAHLWHLWFLCAAYKCTYLLTYLYRLVCLYIRYDAIRYDICARRLVPVLEFLRFYIGLLPRNSENYRTYH